MGRAFELRRARKEKRWDKMAKGFTRLGKEIAIAVKQSGPDQNMNPRLRMAIQNAKAINMPKDRIDAAIKRASSKEEKDFDEVVYEGYGPNGVGILVECATDNTTRTVANIRMYFSRGNGQLGKTGSLEFMFERKGVFKIKVDPSNRDNLEMELIDAGADDVVEEEGYLIAYCKFTDYGSMQKALDEKGIAVVESNLQRIPTSTVQLNEQQEEELMNLIDKFEEDDDVQQVFHNIG